MTPEDQNGGVLYDVVDEVGIDVDRFRLVQGASGQRLYLTGIEFALAAAGFLATRFLRGFVKGLKAGAADLTLDPDKLGERLGTWTLREFDARVNSLGERASKLLSARPEEVHHESETIGAEIEESLVVLREVEAVLPEARRGRGLAEANADLAAAFIESGWSPERAEELAERVARRLLAVTPGSA